MRSYTGPYRTGLIVAIALLLCSCSAPVESQHAEYFQTLAEQHAGTNEQDYYSVAAVQFALEACVQGHNQSCNQLSHAIAKGQGVKPNQALADKWSKPLQEEKIPALYQQTRLWLNSARVQRVSLPDIAAGSCKTIEWQRTYTNAEPVILCRRTPQQQGDLTLAELFIKFEPKTVGKNHASSERASEYLAMHAYISHKKGRSLIPEWFVVSALEPRFGCTVKTTSEKAAFYNPCHGDTWDLQGLPLEGSGYHSHKTLPLNIPPHRMTQEAVILGELPDGSPITYQNYTPKLEATELTPSEQLAHAARWQQYALVIELLASHSYKSMQADPKRADILIQAVSMQYLPMIQLFVDHGFNFEEKTKYGSTAREVVEYIQNPAIDALINRDRQR